MPVSNLPWNCPNPYCEDPHNPSTIVENGVARCHSCGWERRVVDLEFQQLAAGVLDGQARPAAAK